MRLLLPLFFVSNCLQRQWLNLGKFEIMKIAILVLLVVIGGKFWEPAELRESEDEQDEGHMFWLASQYTRDERMGDSQC